MFRRRDIQIPKTPVTGDKATLNWMSAIGQMLQKYIGGGSNDRLVSAQELIDSGVFSSGTGGALVQPAPNLTKPPKVTGLQASGALASIIVQWVNPVFKNYAYTELWRADIDDIGQAFLVARTSVESYIDNVGSSATKYYWTRAISDSGVKGEFNAAAGTKGETSFSPDYVKQILTSLKWQANTTYAPYQYVQPTTENGFQYVVIDGGKSASVEPTWPTTVGLTISDGSVEWKCVAATDRLPLVIGQLDNGDPAVFIDTAFIKNASITSAKIGDLVADKITTGNLNANIRILQKLWYGFDEFANPSEQSGFWMGVEDGVPKLKLDTGLANGNKYFVFDGVNLYMNVDILSGADGYFDDLSGDSVSFNRANFDFLSFGEQVIASQYVFDNDISISDPEFEQYLCYPNGCQKTEAWASSNLIIGTGFSRPYAFFQTGNYTAIKPYDYRSNATRYRANKQNIAFSILVDAPSAAYVNNNYGGTYLTVYVLSESQSLSSTNYNSVGVTDGVPSQYLLKIPVNNHANGTVTAYQNTGSGDVAAFDVDVIYDTQTNTGQIMLKCDDDLGLLGYQGARTLKVAVVYKVFYQAGGSDDDTGYGQISVYMQMRSVAGELTVPENDNTLGITATAGNEQQIATFTQEQLATLNALIAWWNRPEPL